LTALLTAACTIVAPDPNTTKADQKLDVQAFPGCQPAAESPPKLVAGRAPVYPVNRLLADEDGYAILEFDVTTDGRALNFTQIESSHPSFYSHTKSAIAEWIFEPATQDGTNVAVRCRFRQGFSVPYKERR
jgi:outer membrane biosynthesis protein TonB